MNKKPEPEEIRKVLQELEGNILIVEGKKDESALRSLLSGGSWLKPRGSAYIVKINSRPLLETAQDAVYLMEKHKSKQVIILTDFDRTGSGLASRLRLLLQSRKIHANSRIRRDVMNLGIKRIEEMASLPDVRGTLLEGRMSRRTSVGGISKLMERDAYVKTRTYFNEVRGESLHKGKRHNRKARCDRGDIRAD